MHNVTDIPYFAPARNTRLLQVADFVVNAVFGRYEQGYTHHFDQLAPLFDQEDSIRRRGACTASSISYTGP